MLCDGAVVLESVSSVLVVEVGGGGGGVAEPPVVVLSHEMKWYGRSMRPSQSYLENSPIKQTQARDC